MKILVGLRGWIWIKDREINYSLDHNYSPKSSCNKVVVTYMRLLKKKMVKVVKKKKKKTRGGRVLSLKSKGHALFSFLISPWYEKNCSTMNSLHDIWLPLQRLTIMAPFGFRLRPPETWAQINLCSL